MQDAVNQRFNAFANSLKSRLGISSDRSLAAELELHPQVFHNIKHGERGVSLELVSKIVTKYGVSADWILTGRGEMGREMPENGQILAEPAATYALAAPAGAQSGVTLPIPLYNVEAFASIVPLYHGETAEYVEAYIPIPNTLPQDTALRVTGRSLTGIIEEGDIVILREQPITTPMHPERIYLIITAELRTLKFARPEPQGRISLCGTTAAPPITIALADLRRVFAVVKRVSVQDMAQ